MSTYDAIAFKAALRTYTEGTGHSNHESAQALLGAFRAIAGSRETSATRMARICVELDALLFDVTESGIAISIRHALRITTEVAADLIVDWADEEGIEP